MGNKLSNFESRLHQLLKEGNYAAFITEAATFLMTAPYYLILKWSKELIKHHYTGHIDNGDTTDNEALTQSGGNILLQNDNLLLL